MQLKDVWTRLDPSNDNHWTGEGMPRLETVRVFMGDASITREAVTAALPGFTREAARAAVVAVGAVPPQPGEPAQAATPAAAVAPVAAAAPAVVAQGAGDGAVQEGAGVTVADPAGVAPPQDQPADSPLQAAQRILTAALAQEVAAKRAVAEASATVDRLLEADAKQAGERSNAADVQRYLSAQRAALERRADQKAALKGIDLKALLPSRSPLDAGFARRTDRSAKRPVKV